MRRQAGRLPIRLRSHSDTGAYVSRRARTSPNLGAALLEARRLATQVAHVVEILAPHDVVAHNLDLVDVGRVQQEGALDADVVRDAAHSERAVDALAAQLDHNALEHLDALAATLDHFHMHANRITWLYLW